MVTRRLRLPEVLLLVLATFVAILLLRNPSSSPITLKRGVTGRRVTCRAENGVQGVKKSALDGVLCCPVSFQPLKPTFTGSVTGVECSSNGLVYKNIDDTFLDLTPASGKPASVLMEKASGTQNKRVNSLVPAEVIALADTIQKASGGRLRPAELLRDGYTGDRLGLGTSTFQNPLVSGIYERGWRQSFARAGFPGPEKEFETAQKWLLPAAMNGVLVDASCGSGLFTRRFVASQSYSQVIALDYSESMLRETASLCKQNSVWNGGPGFEDTSLTTSPLLIRGDIGRLPFQSNSIDGLHAGAAIHCWPSPALALSEISRVLKPGGRAVLSTFMNPQLPFTDENLRKAIFSQATRNPVIRAWEEGELRSLSESVGLTEFECERNREFIIFKVEKPLSSQKSTPHYHEE